MGLLEDTLNTPVEPGTPPPSWSPAKYDIWKKPSRWQICMPRLRMVAKIVATVIAFVILVKIMNATPPPAPPAPEPVPEVVEPVIEPVIEEITEPPPPPPTEDELMEITMENAKKERWIWKDFTTYVLHLPCCVIWNPDRC
jgi:hypothetical protein